MHILLHSVKRYQIVTQTRADCSLLLQTKVHGTQFIKKGARYPFLSKSQKEKKANGTNKVQQKLKSKKSVLVVVGSNGHGFATSSQKSTSCFYFYFLFYVLAI